jgi:hypothetical protein
VRRIEALALAALGALACGSSERPPQPSRDAGQAPDLAAPDVGGAEAPVADASLEIADFAARYCGLLAPCCPDQDRCRQGVQAMTPYRPAMADACLEALRAPATPSFCTRGYMAAAPACQRVFAGKVATQRLGQPCSQTEDCLLSPQGPVRCAGESGMSRCQVILAGQTGQGPCVATVSGLVTVPAGDPTSSSIMGYACDVANATWCDDVSGKCAPVKATGSACTSFGECGPSGYCDDGTGKCVPRKDEGDACTVDEECPSTFCGEDNRCAPAPTVDPALNQLCARP